MVYCIGCNIVYRKELIGMKRWICLLCVVTLLATLCTGCKEPKDPVTGEKVYTSFPTSLSIEKIGTLPQACGTADGGLYYRIGEKYGIMSFDGTYNSGAIYAMCRPFGTAFMVSKAMGDEADPLTFNTAGVVDARGNVLIPLSYASVVAIDDRYARVAELTGTCPEKEGSITEFTNSAGDEVFCTGNWYIYDLTTGKKIPNATGTLRYASYSYAGKFVKYVTDDKVQHVVTPEGDALPEAASYMTNGYYMLPEEKVVCDAYGTRLFTYDPNGFVPCDDQNSDQYFTAKKTVDGKDVFVLMDMTGAIVSGELTSEPVVCGKLLIYNKRVCNFKGEPLLDAEINHLYEDTITRQMWAASDAVTKEKFLLDNDGNVVYRSGTEVEISFNVNNFDMHRKDGENDPYHFIVKDGSYELKGVAVAPWLVRTTNEDGTYNLVETVSGQTLLSNYTSITVGTAGGTMLYVYTQNAEGLVEIHRVS